MKKLSAVLFAAALVIGITAFAPTPVQAVDWCMLCDESPACFSCCRCDGGTTGDCGYLCGSPDSDETESVMTWHDEVQPLACATTEEAPEVEGVAETQETPEADETSSEASE